LEAYIIKAISVIPGKPDSLIILNLNKPKIQKSTEILVKTLQVGIDGTDFETLNETQPDSVNNKPRMILGHEALGVIKEIGQNVRDFKEGDLVVPTVRRPCNVHSCIPCSNGESDMCITGLYKERGIKELDGYMSEYFVEDQNYLLKIPNQIKDVAVLIEPLSIVEKTIENIFEIQKRLKWDPKTSLILGAGSLGILFSLYLKWRGLKTYVYSRNLKNDIRTNILQGIGVKYISTNDVEIEELKQKLGNIDIIIEATGSSKVAFDGMKILGINGIMALIGITKGNKVIKIPSDKLNLDIVLGNKVIFGAVNSNIRHFEKAKSKLINIKEWLPILRKLITNKYKKEDYRLAFFGSYKQKPIKSIILF
jgi:threonine dehydrogenase-like Zn-dependent dehydrogenase